MENNFILIFSSLVLLTSSISQASRPGGGAEPPAVCTAMGQVESIDKKLNLARVLLKEIAGSSTMAGCSETGVDKLIGKSVSVSLKEVPTATFQIKDFVFVQKGLMPEFSFLKFGSESVETLIRSAQTQWGMIVQQEESFYYFRAFLGPNKSIARLQEILNSAKSDYAANEQRLSAALMLVAMAAFGRFEISDDILKNSFMISLEKSFKGPEIGEHILLLKKNREGLIDELGALIVKKQSDWFAAPDPYGILVALQRLGPGSKKVLPAILKRMDTVGEMVRGKGDDFLFASFETMNAPNEIASLFLKGIESGEIKTKDGVLAKAVCRLKDSNNRGSSFSRQVSWCQKNIKI